VAFRSASRLPAQIPALVVRNVDMAVADIDNALVWQVPVPSRYVVRRMIARRVSGAFGVGCTGGLFTATARGGTALVASSQSYAGLTGAGKIQDTTIAAAATTDVTTAATLYVNFLLANTGALVGDFYVWIDVLDA
jgi:hypothetical protein